jgi:hypothetical protein
MRRVFVLTAQGLAHFYTQNISTPQLHIGRDEMILLGADVLIFYCAVNQQAGMGHVRHYSGVRSLGIFRVVVCL